MSPPKGRYSSRIRKIAPATARAQRHKVVITVAFRGAKSPKLKKLRVSQKTRITNNGFEIESPCCSNISQRVWATSVRRATAWDLMERCISFWGESFSIVS